MTSTQSSTMRALRYHGRGDARVEDVPIPRPRPGEALLQVRYAGVCGSDVHEYLEGPAATATQPHPLTGNTNPTILGHELSGVVVETGSGSTATIGDLVAVEPIETCGSCPRCAAGYRHLCRHLAYHGYNRPGGGFAEYTVVRDDMIHPLPAGVSPLQGALVEPMTVASRAAKRTQAQAGDTVIVHGAGPIGLGAHLTFRDLGVETLVSDPSAERRSVAEKLGCTRVLDPTEDDIAAAVRDLTGGLGAAGAVDAAGVEVAFQSSLRSTRPDGVVVLVGHHHAPINLRSASLIFNEVTVTGSLTYGPGDYAWVIERMARGALPLDEVVTTGGLDDVVSDGIEAMHRHEALKFMAVLSNQ